MIGLIQFGEKKYKDTELVNIIKREKRYFNFPKLISIIIMFCNFRFMLI